MNCVLAVPRRVGRAGQESTGVRPRLVRADRADVVEQGEPGPREAAPPAPVLAIVTVARSRRSRKVQVMLLSGFASIPVMVSVLLNDPLLEPAPLAPVQLGEIPVPVWIAQPDGTSSFRLYVAVLLDRHRGARLRPRCRKHDRIGDPVVQPERERALGRRFRDLHDGQERIAGNEHAVRGIRVRLLRWVRARVDETRDRRIRDPAGAGGTWPECPADRCGTGPRRYLRHRTRSGSARPA